MKCIIIDDEPLALNIMNSYCKEIGNLDVVGTYTNPMDHMVFQSRINRKSWLILSP